MKTQGRKSSDNIVDLRSYFGSDAVDPDYTSDDRFADFLAQSLLNATPDVPQQFNSLQPMDEITKLLWDLEHSRRSE